MNRRYQILALAFVIAIRNVEAQTSLYIPGFEPQPVSANVLGVGPDGRTTWVLYRGHPTDSADHSGFVGTATLVEGLNDASFTYAAAQFTIGQACTFSGGYAICTIVAGGSTNIQTEIISSVPIQGGATIVSSGAVTNTPPLSAGHSTTSTSTFPSGTEVLFTSNPLSTPTATDGAGSGSSQAPSVNSSRQNLINCVIIAVIGIFHAVFLMG